MALTWWAQKQGLHRGVNVCKYICIGYDLDPLVILLNQVLKNKYKKLSKISESQL